LNESSLKHFFFGSGNSRKRKFSGKKIEQNFIVVYWNAAQKHLFADLVYVFSLFWSRLNFSTAFSSNAVSICQNAGLTQITRLEMSARYLVQLEQKGLAISPELENKVSIQLILFLRQTYLSGMD